MKRHLKWYVRDFTLIFFFSLTWFFFVGYRYSYRFDGRVYIIEVPRWADSVETLSELLPFDLDAEVRDWARVDIRKKRYWSTGGEEMSGRLICWSGLGYLPTYEEVIPRWSDPFKWKPASQDVKRRIAESHPDLSYTCSVMAILKPSPSDQPFRAKVMGQALSARSYENTVAEISKLYRSYEEERDYP